MENIILSKQQAREIAQTIYPDIKEYCLVHMDRYFPFLLAELRRAKGKPPIEPIVVTRNLCACCNRYISADDFASDRP